MFTKLFIHTIVVVCLLGAGCAEDEKERSYQQLEHSRQLWRSAGSSNYTMTYDWPCDCNPFVPNPTKLIVQGNQIVEARESTDNTPKKDRGGKVLSTDEIQDYFQTVEQLFALIQFEIEHSDHVEVQYHPTLGYPTNAFFDRMKASDDDELEISITSLTLSQKKP